MGTTRVTFDQRVPMPSTVMVPAEPASSVMGSVAVRLPLDATT